MRHRARQWMAVWREPRERIESRHPRALVWRHMGRGGMQAVVALLGLTVVSVNLEPILGWLVPDIEAPDLHLPPWLDAVADRGEIWFPLLVGLLLTLVQLRRRRRSPSPVSGPDQG